MPVRGNNPQREEQRGSREEAAEEEADVSDGITPRSSSSSLASVDAAVAVVVPPLTSSPLPPAIDSETELEGDREGVAPSPFKDALNESFSAIMASAESADSDGGAVSHGIETFKRINDCIHGTVVFPSVAVAIIDTPQFQRLRNLKQTGNCHLVYPNATHNRFQHSLGVGHLGRVLCNTLRENQPNLGITDVDVNCVMIAGLCHDLGHGPYSHLWEGFIKEARDRRGVTKEYHHEDMSVKMFDRMLEENAGLKDILKEEGGIKERDLLFIKELIVGPLDENGMPDRSKEALDSTRADSAVWPYRGRSEDKSFLYEIIANKITGVDVDKWDYYLRDDYYMRIGQIFDYKRFITFCHVLKTTIHDSTGSPTLHARRRICIRRKESENLQNMFLDRSRLHKHGYQHRCVKILDRMLVDAWLLADAHIKLRGGEGGEPMTLSDTCEYPPAHEKLTDAYVQFRIEEAVDAVEGKVPEDLIRAKEILNRIVRRDLYKVICEINLADKPDLGKLSTEEVLEEILKITPLEKDDLTIIRTKITLGFDPEKTVFFFYENPSMQVSRSSGASVAKSLWPESRSHLLLICYKGPRNSGRERNMSGMKESKNNKRLAAAVEAVEAWKKHKGVSGVGEAKA